MYLWHIPFISSTWICCCISVGIPFVSTTRIYSRIFDTLFISTTGFADASLTHFIISSTRIRSTTGFADVILTHFVHIFNSDLLLYFCRYSIHIHNPELLMHFCRFATNNYNPDSMYIPDITFLLAVAQNCWNIIKKIVVTSLPKLHHKQYKQVKPILHHYQVIKLATDSCCHIVKLDSS